MEINDEFSELTQIMKEIRDCLVQFSFIIFEYNMSANIVFNLQDKLRYIQFSSLYS